MEHVGREQTIKVGDKTYWLSRLERRHLAEFCEWAKGVLPDPLEQLGKSIALYPREIALELARDARKEAQEYLDATHPKVQSLMRSFEGMLQLVKLMLRQNHPDLTDEEIFGIAQEVARDDSFRVDPEQVTGAVGEPS